MSHIHELIDFTAEVFIVYKNTVLLRMHDKYDKWLSVGGHIEANEDPVEAAVREVKEEVGLDVMIDDSLLRETKEKSPNDIIPPYFLNRHRVSPTHEHVTFIYFARAATNVIRESEGHEKSDACHWFSKEELAERTDIEPGVKFHALRALEELGAV